MAEFSPVLSMRDGGGRFGQPIFPRSRSGSESESELSQSLARTKIRSYGSTASVTASLGEKYIEHRVTDRDTLQGIALKYGVTVRLSHNHCGCLVCLCFDVHTDKNIILMEYETSVNLFGYSSLRDTKEPTTKSRLFFFCRVDITFTESINLSASIPFNTINLL